MIQVGNQQQYRREGGRPRVKNGGAALILAAHPDDEAVGVWGWVQQHPGPITVAYLTDGAPRDARWRAPAGHGGRTSRLAYKQERRREAKAAWRGFPQARLAFSNVLDQELSHRLAPAEAWLRHIAEQTRPQLILAPAFEGGHPDHDAANLLAARLSRRLGLEAWEYALYTTRAGAMVRQHFPEAPEWSVTLRGSPAAAKQAALALYASQRATLAPFDAHREALRPLPRHNYRRRPCAPCVYELWGWPWSGEEIAARFAAFLDAGA
jgi:LmbE family N-acetylglucosaminyl deacetylase